MLSCLVLCVVAITFHRMSLYLCVPPPHPPTGFCEALTKQLMEVGVSVTGTVMNDMRVIIVIITEALLRGYV